MSDYPVTEAEALDTLMVAAYSDDDDVDIVDAAVDHNPEHGSNTPEEMDVE